MKTSGGPIIGGMASGCLDPKLQKNRRRMCEHEFIAALGPESINWLVTTSVAALHFGLINAFILFLQGRVGLQTISFCFALICLGIFGTTVGAHRLWAHGSFKAKPPLRIFLAICQSFTLQGSVLYWVTSHRVHHKYSDTELDPLNASRGFFYSHIGWLLMYDPKRFALHPNLVPLGDVEADPVVVWQDRYYDWIQVLGILSTGLIPWLLFGEDLIVGFYACVCARVTVLHHIPFLVNSIAHLYGSAPFDKNIYPRDNKIVSWLTFGEGWHNYHHTYPWDYRCSEPGCSYWFNASAAFIDFCAGMGWVYGLKTALPPSFAAARKTSSSSTQPGKSF